MPIQVDTADVRALERRTTLRNGLRVIRDLLAGKTVSHEDGHFRTEIVTAFEHAGAAS